MRFYVSGGITGIEDARARFEAAGLYLASEGHEALLPYEIPPCTDGTCIEHPGNPRSNGHTWSCWLRYDLAEMLRCDAVLTLPGWQTSRGAVLEVQTALAVSLPVHHLEERDLRVFLRIRDNRPRPVERQEA